MDANQIAQDEYQFNVAVTRRLEFAKNLVDRREPADASETLITVLRLLQATQALLGKVIEDPEAAWMSSEIADLIERSDASIIDRLDQKFVMEEPDEVRLGNYRETLTTIPRFVSRSAPELTAADGMYSLSYTLFDSPHLSEDLMLEDVMFKGTRPELIMHIQHYHVSEPGQEIWLEGYVTWGLGNRPTLRHILGWDEDQTESQEQPRRLIVVHCVRISAVGGGYTYTADVYEKETV